MRRLLALGLIFSLAAPLLNAADSLSHSSVAIWVKSSLSPTMDEQNRVSQVQDRVESVFGNHFEISNSSSDGASFVVFSVAGRSNSLSPTHLLNFLSMLQSMFQSQIKIVVGGSPADFLGPEKESATQNQTDSTIIKDQPPVNFTSQNITAMVPTAQGSVNYDGSSSIGHLPTGPGNDGLLSSRFAAPQAAVQAAAAPSSSPPPQRAVSLPAKTAEDIPLPQVSPSPEDAQDSGILGMINWTAATRLSRVAYQHARHFIGRCYAYFINDLLSVLRIPENLNAMGVKTSAAYQFATSLDDNPKLFDKLKLRRVPGPELQREASQHQLPIGMILVYGRAGSRQCRSGGPKGGVCGFSKNCGHIEVVAQKSGRLMGCSDGCRPIPEYISEGHGSLECIANSANETAAVDSVANVSAYVPVQSLEP